MKLLKCLPFVAFASALTTGADEVERFGFGVSGDDGDGCSIPDAYLNYEYEADKLNAHGRINHKGNKDCEKTVNVDLLIERDFGFLTATVGYDRRGLFFPEYTPADTEAGTPADTVVFYGTMNTAIAAVSYDLDAWGANWQLGWSLIEEAPRAQVTYDVAGLELQADVTGSGSAFATFAASYVLELDNAWGIEFSYGYDIGLDNVKDGIDWKTPRDLNREPVGPPTTAYRYAIGVSRAL